MGYLNLLKSATVANIVLFAIISLCSHCLNLRFFLLLQYRGSSLIKLCNISQGISPLSCEMTRQRCWGQAALIITYS